MTRAYAWLAVSAAVAAFVAVWLYSLPGVVVSAAAAGWWARAAHGRGAP